MLWKAVLCQQVEQIKRDPWGLPRKEIRRYWSFNLHSRKPHSVCFHCDNQTRCPCFFTEPWICSVATGAKAKNKIKLRCACRCSWCNMEILIRNLKYTSVFLNLKRYKICNILNTNITQLGSCTPLNFAPYAKLLEIYPRIIFMLVCKVCMELKSWQCLDLGSYNFFLFLN